MTLSARAALSVVGALLLIGSVVAVFVTLVLREPFQSHLLPTVLLIPLGVVAVPKVWKRPALGVAAIVVLIAVPWRTGGEGAGLAHVTMPDLAAAALAGIVAVRTLVLGDQGRLRSWIILPLAGVVVAGSVATLAASDPATSLSGLVRYAEIFVVVPAATYLALQSQRDLKLILAVVISLGVFEGAFGVYQFFTGTGAAIGEANVRAVGTFGAYNIMGLATVVTYALVAATAVFVGLRDGRRYWALLLMLALLFPLAFSLSRGAWIAAAVGVMVVVALDNWKRCVLFILAGGLALVIALGVFASGVASGGSGVVAERLDSLISVGSAPDQSTLDRYAMWQTARDMWVDRPLTGVGLKNFPYFRDIYAPLSFSGGGDIEDSGGFRRVELLSPHNLYWLVLAEQGLVGALAYGVLFLSLGIVGFRRLLKTKESSLQRVSGLFFLGSLAAYLVSCVYGDVGGSTMVLEAVLFGGVVWLASGAELSAEIEETNETWGSNGP